MEEPYAVFFCLDESRDASLSQLQNQLPQDKAQRTFVKAANRIDGHLWRSDKRFRQMGIQSTERARFEQQRANGLYPVAVNAEVATP